MKVLRIYDHLGELKKEFNVFVEGEDFKWQSGYPEPVWLGTISLEDAGKEPEAEPTPEVVAAEPTHPFGLPVARLPFEAQPEVTEPEPEVLTEEEELEQAPFLKQSIYSATITHSHDRRIMPGYAMGGYTLVSGYLPLCGGTYNT